MSDVPSSTAISARIIFLLRKTVMVSSMTGISHGTRRIYDVLSTNARVLGNSCLACFSKIRRSRTPFKTTSSHSYTSFSTTVFAIFHTTNLIYWRPSSTSSSMMQCSPAEVCGLEAAISWVYFLPGEFNFHSVASMSRTTSP